MKNLAPINTQYLKDIFGSKRFQNIINQFALILQQYIQDQALNNLIFAIQIQSMSFFADNIILIFSIIIFCLIPTIVAQQYKYFIFTHKCYHSLVEQFNIQDFQCMKLSASKLMGYGLVVGSAIVKIPQVIKVAIDKSVYGISFTSIVMESLTNWVTIVYSWYRGNPFSIYGENVFILGQNLLIMLLFLIYGRNVPKGVQGPTKNTITKYGVILAAFCVLMFLTQNPYSWPPVFVNYSMVLQIVLFSMARLTQIIHIYRCKSTGSLAFITCFLILAGNFGRLFTVLVQIGEDYMFAISVILATLLNGTILAQFFIYWKNNPKVQDKKQKGQ